jgi:hypothetical protein
MVLTDTSQTRTMHEAGIVRGHRIVNENVADTKEIQAGPATAVSAIQIGTAQRTMIRVAIAPTIGALPITPHANAVGILKMKLDDCRRRCTTETNGSEIMNDLIRMHTPIVANQSIVTSEQGGHHLLVVCLRPAQGMNLPTCPPKLQCNTQTNVEILAICSNVQAAIRTRKGQTVRTRCLQTHLQDHDDL